LFHSKKVAALLVTRAMPPHNLAFKHAGVHRGPIGVQRMQQSTLSGRESSKVKKHSWSLKSRNGFAATSTDSQTHPHPFVFGFPVVLDDGTIRQHLARN
jgi:hypothetical protein